VSRVALDLAATLHARAVRQHNLGHSKAALGLLARARELAGSADELRPGAEARALLAAIWISIAVNEADINGVEAGMRALASARVRATELADPGLLVRLHNQAATILSRAGRFDEALVEFDAALAMIEHANQNDHFVILLNSGTLRMLRGEWAAARSLLGRAVAYAAEIGISSDEFKALHNLGYLEFLRGDLPRALRLMEHATRLDSQVSLGVPLLDRARVLFESGLVREASETLVRAETIFRRERLGQDLGETELERARCVLLAGDVGLARRLAARARDRFRRRGNDQSRRAAELVLLRGDLAAGRPGTRLVGPAQRLAGEFAAEGLRLPAITAALIAVEAELSAGQIDAADLALVGIEKPTRRDPITVRLHYSYARAAADRALGRPGRATRRARNGLDDLARYQASFGSIDLSTAAAVHGRRLAELDVSIALESDVPAAVFAAAEHARAVAGRLPSVRPPADPRAAELLAELRQTVESLRAVEQDNVAAAPLLRRRRQLENEVSLLGWTRSGLGKTVSAAVIDDVRGALSRSDAAMVMYLETAGGMHAVVLDGTRTELRTIGDPAPITELVRRVRADLDVLAQPRLPNGLRDAVRASFSRSTAALDDLLIRPLDVRDQAMVIVSTGVLGQLPWGLLPSLSGAPVVVAPSATVWLRAATRRRGRRRAVVALAGPDLDRAAQEVAGVGESWDGASIVTGPAASGRAAVKAMAHAGVLHLAAHGVHQTENPLFSSLRLADGALFAHELDQTVRTPEHVVLSACELGLATVRPGDEALGLTSVLLHLGTRSVVAGVARVSDELAAETMVDYHRLLAKGLDSASALAEVAGRSSEPVPFVAFGAAWSA
jgi:tetratricopeptide (TPR) repeat protein